MSAVVTSFPTARVDPDPTDAALLAAAREGDGGAIEALAARHVGGVTAVCRARLTCPHDVNDAVQETFVRALTRLGDVRDDARVGAWLRAIAGNVCVDLHRAAGRTVAVGTAGATAQDHDRTPEEHALGRDTARTLHRRLLSLSDRDRRALWLRDAHGLDVPSVAEDLGVTEGSVRVLLTRARRRLRASYQGLTGLLIGGGVRLRQRLAEPWTPTALDLRYPAVAQATVAAVIVLAGLPATGGGASPGSSPRPVAVSTVGTAATASEPAADERRTARATQPSRRSMRTGPTRSGVGAGPVVISDGPPDEEPAARVEADNEGTRVGGLLVYAGNLLEPAPADDGATDEDPDGSDPPPEEDGSDEEDTIRVGSGQLAPGS